MNRTYRTSIVTVCIATAAAYPSSQSYAMSMKETLTDRCSAQVVVKVPYTSAKTELAQIDPDDVILDRTGNFKHMIQPQGPNRGVSGVNKKGYTAWTSLVSPVPTNSDRFFRWVCGTTAERSRCAAGTKAISARLGPDRLMETRCYR